MNASVRIAVLAVTFGGMIGLATGCQDMHRENVQLAELRWARARAGIMLQLAEQQYRNGQLDKAMTTINKAAALDSTLPRLAVLRGQILAERGQGQQAIVAFEEAIVLDARCAEAHYQCGSLYERWGQFDKALISYRSAHDLEPANVVYAVAVAELLGQLDLAGDGLAMVEKMLVDQPQSVALRVTAGELCQLQGQHVKAAEHFKEAARVAGDDPAVVRSLALALHRAGRYSEARAHLEQLLRQRSVPQASATPGGQATDPTATTDGQVPMLPGERVELLLALGDCCLQTDRLDQAREAFLEVVRLSPRRAVGWECLAKVAMRQGRWAGVVSAADRATEIEPASVGAHLARGYALLQLDRPAEAVWSFQQAHRLAPKDVLMLCMMADGYRRMGDMKSARDSLVRALQIAPDDPLAGRMINQLADARAGRGRPAAEPADLAPPTVTAGVRVDE